MEHFHSWGLLEKVRAARVLPPDFSLSGVTAYMNLSTEYWYSPPFREVVNQYYFQNSERVPQYLTERVLRDRMAEFPGIESFMGWTVDSIEQDQDRVCVGMVAPDGTREVIEGDYAIGCDGSHSIVREQVGIARGGEDFDQLMVLTVIRSPELEAGLKRFRRGDLSGDGPGAPGPLAVFRASRRGGYVLLPCAGHAQHHEGQFRLQGLMEKATGFTFRCGSTMWAWDLRISRRQIPGSVASSSQGMPRLIIRLPAAQASTMASTTSSISAGSSPRLNGWGSVSFADTYTEERQPIFWKPPGLHPRAHRGRPGFPRSLQPAARPRGIRTRLESIHDRDANAGDDLRTALRRLVDRMGAARKRLQRNRDAFVRGQGRASPAAAGSVERTACVRGAWTGFHLAGVRRGRFGRRGVRDGGNVARVPLKSCATVGRRGRSMTRA
jgi:hypothetical protein